MIPKHRKNDVLNNNILRGGAVVARQAQFSVYDVSWGNVLTKIVKAHTHGLHSWKRLWDNLLDRGNR